MQIDPRNFVAQPMMRASAVIGGETAPDDYSIRCAGRVLGRIRLGSNGEWYWSLTGPIIITGNSGREASYEAARDAFKARFDAWLVEEVAHWEAHGPRANWVPDAPEWRKGL